jgi:hypothetical protein
MGMQRIYSNPNPQWQKILKRRKKGRPRNRRPEIFFLEKKKYFA